MYFDDKKLNNTYWFINDSNVYWRLLVLQTSDITTLNFTKLSHFVLLKQEALRRRILFSEITVFPCKNALLRRCLTMRICLYLKGYLKYFLYDKLSKFLSFSFEIHYIEILQFKFLFILQTILIERQVNHVLSIANRCNTRPPFPMGAFYQTRPLEWVWWGKMAKLHTSMNWKKIWVNHNFENI